MSAGTESVLDCWEETCGDVMTQCTIRSCVADAPLFEEEVTHSLATSLQHLQEVDPVVLTFQRLRDLATFFLYNARLQCVFLFAYQYVFPSDLY